MLNACWAHNNAAQSLITAPAFEPVTLSEVKTHLRVDHFEEDGLLNGYICAARDWAERRTRRSFITQTWEVRIDDFPQSEDNPHFVLPRGKLQSISSVQYLDTSNVLQTLSSSVYEADTFTDPGRLVLAYDQDWPDVLDHTHAVRIQFVCGYGDTPASVPGGIKEAILYAVGHNYENRTMVAVTIGGSSFVVPKTAEYKLEPFRLRHQ